jgi:transposase
MKKYQFHVGIDVSKLKLDINILNSETYQSEHLIINNTPKEITKFISVLTKRKIDLNAVLFCCENTGIYTNHLSFVLIKMQLDLWIVPAIEIKRSKGISRGKNDKTDAKDISFYSYRNQDKIKLFALNDIDIQKLKILFAEREKMVKVLLLLQTTKENESFTDKIIFKEVSMINEAQLKS